MPLNCPLINGQDSTFYVICILLLSKKEREGKRERTERTFDPPAWVTGQEMESFTKKIISKEDSGLGVNYEDLRSRQLNLGCCGTPMQWSLGGSWCSSEPLRRHSLRSHPHLEDIWNHGTKKIVEQEWIEKKHGQGWNPRKYQYLLPRSLSLCLPGKCFRIHQDSQPQLLYHLL